MSEEEFFNRMINQISKVFDGTIATKMKNIYLKKEKQLNKQKEVLDKIKKELEEPDIYGVDEDGYDDAYYDKIYVRRIEKLLEEIK